MKIKVTITGWTEVPFVMVQEAVKEELGVESDDEQVIFGHFQEMINSVTNRQQIAEILNANHIESIKAKLLKS